MLSYRHAFHAGNHADVLKHAVLVALLDYLTGKPKPLWYVDTHAGAGLYRLDQGFAADFAREKGEHHQGIARLWQRAPLPPALARYVDLVRELNPGGNLTTYPGSPWFAQRLLRAGDRLWLHELHPADHAALAAAVHGRSVHLAREDGLAALRRLLPPQPRRALVLIDPSYEVKNDYVGVIRALREAQRRFAAGCYAVWYPLIVRPQAEALPGQLAGLGARRWLHARLRVRRPGAGLHGSGMFVINPPFTLPETLNACLPELTGALAQDDAAGFELDWHID